MSTKKLSKSYGDVLWSGKKCYFGLPISFTRYILTPTKLYSRIGFLSIKEERIELYRVVDLSLKLPLSQRIFGCGTVIVHAKDRTSPTKEIKSIKGTRNFLNLLEEYVQKERERYKVHGRDMIGMGEDFGE
ncbi:MAG: PH domain-containing protein [Defluviitaleaceae bacterium]|nr:PH domain-containing protein [Defluviitaleaceae bacterium]